jgi:hypothetical protein
MMIMSGMEAAVIDDPITKMMNLMSPMLLCRFDPFFFFFFPPFSFWAFFPEGQLEESRTHFECSCYFARMNHSSPLFQLPLIANFTSKEYHTLLYVGAWTRYVILH